MDLWIVDTKVSSKETIIIEANNKCDAITLAKKLGYEDIIDAHQTEKYFPE